MDTDERESAYLSSTRPRVSTAYRDQPSPLEANVPLAVGHDIDTVGHDIGTVGHDVGTVGHDIDTAPRGDANGRRAEGCASTTLVLEQSTAGDPASPSLLGPASRSPWQRWVKRGLDVVVAPLVLLALSPVLALSAIAIRLESPGPVIFRQRRVGAGGRPFVVLKLRTMYDGNDDGHHRAYVAALLEGRAERRGGLYKLTDDDRITRVGRLLRSCSLDEVPQLVNVLRGEMTLVGPRPAPPNEVALYDDRQRNRLAGTPGITGLWQVSGRSELGYTEMIELDLEYLENWSIGRDLRVLARTPLVVLSRRGAA